MALIMVLLLLAVVSSLATGLAMNGQVEVAMASNEVTYAGARAAAEAGMNRAIAAIVANTTDDLLDSFVTTGDASFLLTAAPPYTIGVNDEFSYLIEIFDDDDPALYPVALTAGQLAAMGEDGDPLTNINERLILRVTGFGPNNTMVRVGRILETVMTQDASNTSTLALTNPALLVNGDLTIAGNITIGGSQGNVHANGNLTANGGAWSVSGDVTASGTATGNAGQAGGVFGGGRPTINVPNIDANDYLDQATHILNANGTITTVGATPACGMCGWSFSGGTWSITGNSATAGTYFVHGSARISGNTSAGGQGKNKTPLALSVIATGSIQVSGTPVLRPHNGKALQFVTNGDLAITGNADLDQTQVEGQSLVREQFRIAGNPDLRGQIIVQNVTDCSPCSNLVTANQVTGNIEITYDGSFEDLTFDDGSGPPADPTFVNNVIGWIEGM